MTREEAKAYISSVSSVLSLKMLEAIKALEQESCEDAISRVDAIKCGLTDADTDKYAVQIQNGEGYYNSDGRYVSYDLD